MTCAGACAPTSGYASDDNADATRGLRVPVARSRRALGAEDGIALILSVIVMGVLTIADRRHDHGGDLERARLRPRPTDEPRAQHRRGGPECGRSAVKALPATATSCRRPAAPPTDGSWSYTATRAQDSTNPDLYYWTITSTGVSPDGNVTRIVSTKVSQTITHHSTTQTSTTIPRPHTTYGFFLGDASSDCATVGTGNNFSGNLDDQRQHVRRRVALLGRHQREHARAGRDRSAPSTCTSARSSRSPEATLRPSERFSLARLRLRVYRIGDGRRRLRRHRGNHRVQLAGDPTKRSNQSGYGSGIYAAAYSSTQINIPPPTINTAWYRTRGPGPRPAATTTQRIPRIPPRRRRIRAATPPRPSRAPFSTTTRR